MPHAAASVAVPALDRRGTTRAATVFTIGKVEFDAASRPCMVRDISEGGMRIQMATLPPVDARIRIEMRGLAPRHATVRWVGGREAGVAFDEPCDLTQVFEARLNQSGQRARPPRFDLNHSVELVIGVRKYRASIVNISVGGARLILDEPVACGAQGVVRLNLGLAFDSIAGAVRWAADDMCGFHFACPISSLSLALALEAWEASARS